MSSTRPVRRNSHIIARHRIKLPFVMSNPPAKRAGFSTTQRQPDLRLSTSEREQTRGRSVWVIRMQREYRFLSSSRGSPLQRCAIVRAALDIPRTCYNECIVNPPKRRQPRRSHSTVHGSFVGIPRRVDDQFRASQGSVAGPTCHRAHCWQGFYDAGTY
jgi:hypothetical protein